ncbi:hypothetical protein CON39_11675 [Bacillus thuringiensis]|uniref:hypothetical protein n=1 Tax=Bacillus thuringiensis TaxID=1428 RepID=UPI000BEBBA33|nr:hypothetical protein [Bacillus thuringiensis]PEF30325.1 hypothetical protein CON39_11675 [Bacillus thuringiensis]
MAEYVILLSSEAEPEDVHNSYGYWGGKTYTSGGMVIPSIGVCFDEDIKKYKSRRRAETMAEKLADRCGYVLSWSVKEVD